jgi:hypothetical protein
MRILFDLCNLFSRLSIWVKIHFFFSSCNFDSRQMFDEHVCFFQNKAMSDKSRWSFCRRSTRHRVLKNSDISEPETLSSSKAKSDITPSNNAYSSTYSYVSKKPLNQDKQDEKILHQEKSGWGAHHGEGSTGTGGAGSGSCGQGRAGSYGAMLRKNAATARYRGRSQGWGRQRRQGVREGGRWPEGNRGEGGSGAEDEVPTPHNLDLFHSGSREAVVMVQRRHRGRRERKFRQHGGATKANRKPLFWPSTTIAVVTVPIESTTVILFHWGIFSTFL